MLLRQHPKLFPRTLRLHHTLFEQEFAQTRLVPCVKRVRLKTVEDLLHLGVLFGGPG